VTQENLEIVLAECGIITLEFCLFVQLRLFLSFFVLGLVCASTAGWLRPQVAIIIAIAVIRLEPHKPGSHAILLNLQILDLSVNQVRHLILLLRILMYISPSMQQLMFFVLQS
jgi:hypothetical protein